MDPEAESQISPPVIITPDIHSFPTKFRVKKVLSRTSLATDRFSCVSFLTSSHRSEHSTWIPRWRSLPCNLEEEIFYDDCPDFLNAWSRYRITNMARRYKTMDYIHMVLSDANSELNTELDGCDLSMTVGISVSRDLLNCSTADYSEHGSGIVPRSTSDDNLQYCDSEADKQCNLTRANLSAQCLAASRTSARENLNMDPGKIRKIQKWLQRCNSSTQDELTTEF